MNGKSVKLTNNDISFYSTDPSEIFSTYDSSYMTGKALDVAKNNKVVQFYIHGITTIPSGNALGTLKSTLHPYLTSGHYVVFPIYSKTSPYLPCGTLWIYTDGRIFAYADTSQSPYYCFGTYISV